MTGGLLADWGAYDRWNLALADEFFSGRFGGRPVYLDLEEDALARIAAEAGDESDDPAASLIEVVRPSLHLRPGASIFGTHRRRLTRWRQSGSEGAPPVIAVLAVLSLVAEQMVTDESFRASNYYGRFLRTLGYPGDDHTLRQKVVRCFGEESHVLWNALNEWISADSAVRGTPTAFSFDYRVHVGVPMSQALVRDADRNALTGLFMDFRLSPGQQISHGDMVRLLREWLPDSQLSGSLKLLCSSDEAISRVADVACVELSAWQGGGGAPSAARNRIGFVAGLRRRPRPRLSLGLAVRVGSADVRELFLDGDSGPAARAAVEPADGRMILEEPDTEGWADVSNTADLDLGQALVAIFDVRADRLRIRRIPRRLVVLEYDDDRRRYQEVDRARLGGHYLLLAAESLSQLLEGALEEAARPGWVAHQDGSVAGVPPGWRLYSGIELIGMTSSKQIDLSGLVPVAWTQLSLVGGCRLSGRGRWLASAPPEVSASSLAGDPVFAVLIDESESEPDGEDVAQTPGERRATEGEEEARSDGSDAAVSDGSDEPDPLPGSATREYPLGAVKQAEIFDLADEELVDGRYRVALLSSEDPGSSALTSVAFSLHSPSRPDELAVPLRHQVPLDAQSVLSAGPVQQGIRGASIPDVDDEPPSHGTSVPETLSERTHIDDQGDGVAIDQATTQLAMVSLPTCMETGAHLFRLPPASPRSRESRVIHAVCAHCGIERFFPARPNRRRRENRRELLSRAASAPMVPSRAESDGLNWDRLLEALSTVAGGSWGSFDRLVGPMDDRPWASIEAARALSACGHIDVELDPRTLRPTRWSIAEPVIATSEGDAFLAGWRSEELLSAIGAAATRTGGRVDWEPSAEGPMTIRLVDTRDELRSIAESASAQVGRRVEVHDEPGARLARLLPSLDSLRSRLPTTSAPIGERLERLDPSSGRWRQVDDIRQPGAYRALRPPARCWLQAGATWHHVDARLAKWLAAEPASPLMAYAEATEGLACHVGARLPWLYERAAVLCSGHLAIPDDAGHVVYQRVPKAVARRLAGTLLPSPTRSTDAIAT